MNSDALTLQSVLDELRRISDGQLQVIEALADLKRLRELAPDDKADLGELCPLVNAIVGSDSWAAAHLDQAAKVRRSPETDSLAELIDSYRTADGGLRAFGRFLARCEGALAGRWRLERVGTGSAGTIYCVKAARRADEFRPP